MDHKQVTAAEPVPTPKPPAGEKPAAEQVRPAANTKEVATTKEAVSSRTVAVENTKAEGCMAAKDGGSGGQLTNSAPVSAVTTVGPLQDTARKVSDEYRGSGAVGPPPAVTGTGTARGPIGLLPVAGQSETETRSSNPYHPPPPGTRLRKAKLDLELLELRRQRLALRTPQGTSHLATFSPLRLRNTTRLSSIRTSTGTSGTGGRLPELSCRVSRGSRLPDTGILQPVPSSATVKSPITVTAC